jgi:pilus assembly protein CpaE
MGDEEMANILVIDDNTDLLQMMRLILRDRGKHNVTLSADGADGLSRALTSPPDLAIVDVMMPGITGYDIVRRLREQPQTAEIPILILTARGHTIDRQTALQAGANDHMAKPAAPQALLDKVDELLTLHGAPKAGESQEGKVISLLSLRGGVGVTTLAVNLALSGVQALRAELPQPAPQAAQQASQDSPQALRQQLEQSSVQNKAKRSVCLVDLSPSSGQAALHLRVKAQRTWAALPGLGPDPSPDALLDLLTAHPSGLQLLAAPFEPIYANTLSALLVDGALSGLKSRFNLVVADIPPLIDVVAAAALDSSDHIILVLTPEVGAIQATLAVLQVMDEVKEKVMVVLNHITPQSSVPEATVEKALRRPITLKIPYDPGQVAALPQGKPLAWANPSSPLATAIGQLIERLR